jgi:hypothetical protein
MVTYNIRITKKEKNLMSSLCAWALSALIVKLTHLSSRYYTALDYRKKYYTDLHRILKKKKEKKELVYMI